ncbi:radical SAM protein [Paenibacillus sp. strain BS8-2]
MAVKLAYTEPKSLLNKGTGFLQGYSHTLNPYAGCAFACSYCYVRGMPVSLFRGEPWGQWVDIKQGGAATLRKELAKAYAKGPVTIFMSSSTDPYQPAEAKEYVTRTMLETMSEMPPDFLLVQTRSPLVTRDMDLLLKLGDRVRVSMTVETDREEIRKVFSPAAPPIAARLKGLRQLAQAGVPTQAAVAPILPSSERFAETLRAATDRVCIDDYYLGDGSGGKRTMRLGIDKLYEDLGLKEWYSPTALQGVHDRLAQVFPAGAIRVSQDGFLP